MYVPNIASVLDVMTIVVLGFVHRERGRWVDALGVPGQAIKAQAQPVAALLRHMR